MTDTSAAVCAWSDPCLANPDDATCPCLEGLEPEPVQEPVVEDVPTGGLL